MNLLMEFSTKDLNEPNRRSALCVPLRRLACLAFNVFDNSDVNRAINLRRSNERIFSAVLFGFALKQRTAGEEEEESRRRDAKKVSLFIPIQLD